MSKIRMALMKECSYVAVAWIDKSGVGQAIKINLPRRKQEVLQRALKEGIDFPEPKPQKQAPKGAYATTESDILYKKPSLILPASAVEETDQPGPKIIV